MDDILIKFKFQRPTVLQIKFHNHFNFVHMSKVVHFRFNYVKI